MTVRRPPPSRPQSMGEGEGGGARPARGALRPRCVLVQYGEGPMGEPAGRRLVVAVDRRLQQKRSWIILARCNQELTLPTLTGQGPFIMVSSRMLKKSASATHRG